MGKCQSKRKSEYHLQEEETIDLEKTLQSCLNEKDEYKEKYETCNRRYSQLKSQLVKSLRTVKDLQRQLTLSEENASALFLRYAIETDLNRRLRQSQTKLEKENERLQKSSRNETSFCPNSEVLQRLHKFEKRIFLVECRLRDDL